MQMAAVSISEPTPAAKTPSFAGKGIVAVVLYEYEATEDNEINLAEGDFVEHIEEIDEGWWSGVGPDGKTGLFPCLSFLYFTFLLQKLIP